MTFRMTSTPPSRKLHMWITGGVCAAVWAGGLGGASLAEPSPTVGSTAGRPADPYVDPHLPDANGNIPANQEGPPELTDPDRHYGPDLRASPPPSLVPGDRAAAAGPVNGRGAANWAFNNIDTKWEYKNNDCANFVSKALHFGGGMQMRPGGRKADNAWWQGKYGFGKSWAWTSAEYLRRHTTKWRHSQIISKEYSTKVGDLVFIKWKREKVYNHAAIVNSVNQGHVHLVQHGIANHTSLREVINRYKSTKNPIEKITFVRVKDRK